MEHLLEAENALVVHQRQDRYRVVHKIRDIQDAVRHPVEGHTHARHGRRVASNVLCVVKGTNSAGWCQTIHAVLNVYLHEAAIGQCHGKDRTSAAIGQFPQQGVPHRALCERARHLLGLPIYQRGSENAASGLVRRAGKRPGRQDQPPTQLLPRATLLERWQTMDDRRHYSVKSRVGLTLGPAHLSPPAD